MSGEVPEVVDEDEDVDDAEAEDVDVQEETDEATPEDVDEAVVDLSDDDMGGSLFDGVEDGDTDGDVESGESGGESGGGDDEDDGAVESAEDAMGPTADALEDSINEGVARLAVVGLEDADLEDSDMTKKGLENEFAEVFETFRLGYFGSRFVEEYVLTPQDGDVDPTWGLLGSALMATAMVVWMRPDGDEAIQKARDQIGDLAGGIA